MSQTTVTTETTAQDLLALSPEEREAAYRALRDTINSDFALLSASQRSHEAYVRRSREAGYTARADRAEQEHEQTWSDYERLAHLKALLARLTGRSSGYTARAAWQDEVRAIDEALRVEMPVVHYYRRCADGTIEHMTRADLDPGEITVDASEIVPLQGWPTPAMAPELDDQGQLSGWYVGITLAGHIAL